jgi:hypothetical protein
LTCAVTGTVTLPAGSTTGSGTYNATCAGQSNPPLGPAEVTQRFVGADSPSVAGPVCGVVGSITSGPGNPSSTDPPWGGFRIDFDGPVGEWTWTDPSITGKGVVNISTNQLQTAPSCPTQYTFSGTVTLIQ